MSDPSRAPAPSPAAGDVLWTPSPERVRAAQMTAFREDAAREAGRQLPDYAALHAWSVEEPDVFWRFLARWLGLELGAAPRARSDDPMPRTRWFEGATLNYARELLRPRTGGVGPEDPAVIEVREDGREAGVTRAGLAKLAARVEAALAREGVGAGDRVAAFASNRIETVALLLGCAARGAVFTSCSPDFGLEAARARFAQVEPRLLFASRAYRYAGRRFDVGEAADGLAAALPGLRRAVALPVAGEDEEGSAPDGAWTAWGAWLEPEDAVPDEPPYAELPFDHPLYVLYSSGTTGLPKAMVHRAGGALLQHLKEHRLHCDVRPGDRAFYFTTCGWMMWNWLVSGLAAGAAIVLYDGSPTHPDPLATFRMAEAQGVTFFGTGARFLHALMGDGLRPRDHADLSRVRTIASTGSPLAPAAFRWVYDAVAPDVHLASISGGTDIVSCFMLGVPTLPVRAGEIQAPGLGVDLAVFDDDGRSVEGEPGELVCRQPLPCMPLRFWGDPDGKRYRDAYFDVFEGVWRHGDRIERTPSGGIVVYGRSDATLNPGGVRIGTAEIYRPLERVPEVVEAAAVGRREGGDEEVWLLVVLADGATLDDELTERIRGTIRRDASPRHAPRRIVAVPDLPRTRSGKTTEIAIARLVNGEEVPNREVMANPEALDGIREVLEREGGHGG